jgi:hypothetical protein
LRAYIRVDNAGRSSIITKEIRDGLQRDLRILIGHLDILEAKVTRVAANDLITMLGDENITWDRCGAGLKDINTTLNRELTLIRLFVIESEKLRYFEPKSPIFGSEFEVKYISAVYELDEAAKCLALSRPTACVFHLMRIMEIGIRAVAQCLGIPDPVRASDRNWGKILEAIKKELDAHRGQAPTKQWMAHPSSDGSFFDEVYVSLDAVRIAWRNATMHVEKKYTDDEAEHVLVAVKGFMMKLVSRCDENGDPKA